MGETTRAYGTQSPILVKSRKISKYYVLTFLVCIAGGGIALAGDDCSVDAHCHYEKGMDALLEENFPVALSSFRKAQQLDPSLELEEEIDGLIFLSETSSLDIDGIDSGDNALADDDCSNNALCHLDKGVDAVLEENYPAAITAFNKAQELDPSLELEEMIEELNTLSETGSPEESIPPKEMERSVATVHTDTASEPHAPVTVSEVSTSATEIGPRASETGKAEPKTLLFEGSLGDQWKELSWSGGDYKKFARIENSVLLVNVPAGNGYGNTGIRSSEPLIEFPEEDGSFATRLSISIEPELSSAFVVALIPPNWDGIKEWRSHHIRLSVFENAGSNNSTLGLWFKGKEVMQTNVATDSLRTFSILLRPDKLVFVSDKAGKLLVQGILPKKIEPPEKGYRLSILALAPEKGEAATLALKTVSKSLTEGDYSKTDPLFWPTPSREVHLFAAPILDERWTKYGALGGDFQTQARLDDKALLVNVHEGNNWGFVGLRSEKPLIWLDEFGEGAEVRVRFNFDSDRTTGFATAISPFLGLPSNAPSTPMVYLHWRKLEEGGAKLALALDGTEKPIWDVDVPERVPENLDIILQPGRFKILAPGAPADFVDWAALTNGQGFRVYAYSRPDKANDPVKMALKEISVTSVKGKRIQENGLERGVLPLPIKHLFTGTLNEWWEVAGVQVKQPGDFVDFADDAMIAENPGKSNRDRVGLLSKMPVLDIDERILSTSHKLTLKVDPEETSGIRAMLYKSKVADMWRSYLAASITFTKHTEGDNKGKYVLSLRSDKNDYRHWWRTIDSEWVNRNWDGSLIIETGDRWMSVTIPGGPVVRGVDLPVSDGSKLFMTLYANPEKDYGKGKLILKDVSSQWVEPAGMSKLGRWNYLDVKEFDPDQYLRDLMDELK